MEDALVQDRTHCIKEELAVLILVLMEDALVHGQPVAGKRAGDWMS